MEIEIEAVRLAPPRTACRAPRRSLAGRLAQEGEAAEHAAVACDGLDHGAELRLVFGRESRSGSSATACNATRPFQASRISANTGQEIAVCLPIESICVRTAPVPCAKAQRSAKSMRLRTSSADQFASRSAITAIRAPEERAVRILRAPPDVTLVDMGVHVDQARQHDATLEIEARKSVLHRGSDGGDAAIVDHDVAGREAVGVGRKLRGVRQAYRHARIGEAETGDV